MSLFGILIIVCLVLSALIGFAVGLFKGYTRVSSWGIEFLLCSVCTIGLGAVVYNSLGANGGDDSGLAGLITLMLAIVFMIIFMVLCYVFRRVVKAKIAAHEKHSYYEQYEDREENKEDILDAVYYDDTEEFKRLIKEDEKFKPKKGPWGWVDRFVGAGVLLIKGVVICGLMFAILLAFFDLANFPVMSEVFESTFASSTWVFVKQHLFDFLIIGLLFACVRCGYSSGISTAVWSIVVIGLVVGSGLLAYYFAFKVDAFIRLAEGMKLGAVDGIINTLSQIGIPVTTTQISQIVVMLILLAVFLVFVVLISIFVPKAISAAREGNIFYMVDGFLGAFMLTVIVMGIMLFIGGVMYSVHDFEFMETLNPYFENSRVATYFYGNNILVSFNIMEPTLLRSWLGG